MDIRKKILCAFFAVIMLVSSVCLFCGCESKSVDRIESLDDLGKPGKRIGVGFDIPEYEMLKRDYPEATIIPYNDSQLAYEDILGGRLDAYVYDRVEIEIAIANGKKGLRIIDGDYSTHTIAVGLSPKSDIPDIQKKINAFIAEIRGDGTLDDMYDRWVVKGDETMPDIPAPEDPSFKLRVGTTGNIMAFTYYSGTDLTGFDIELARRFAAWLGADIEFKVYDFGGVLAAAATGDIDCIMSDLYKTAERSEVIPFSDALLEFGTAAVVLDDEKPGGIKELSDLKYGKIAVMTGTVFYEHVQNRLPDATIAYFNTTADEINALMNGKVDAVAVDEPVAHSILAQNRSLAVLPDLLETLEYGFIFQKNAAGETLRNEFDTFFSGIKSDGTLDSLQKKWFNSEDVSVVEMPDYRKLTASKGTIKIATIQNPPFSFSMEEIAHGYEIEIAYMFCRENGYALEVTDVNMDAIIATVQSGKHDAACAGICITDERKETLLFSLPDYSGGTALIVRKSGSDENVGFFESIADSFNKTFIRENRWKLFLSGIGTTLLITTLSVIFGTLIGFIAFMLCRKGNRVANAITRFFIWLIHGMPVVVLLMILYYIIFSNVPISGAVVSIVGFMLIFGSAVFNMLKSGVGAIDRGQTEAAYALGFTDRRTFFRIILPQTLPYFMPNYKGEIVTLIKATAVVGYVAVQDLTKMGDIVRSRTYEAFFPLIAVAIIYFILAAILTFIVKKIEIRIDPKRRSRKSILKGVNVR